jgi:secreted Zn-dependent insulinase-like peptidase
VTLQGAAHLLEHMLFAGSERFPGEGELERHITAHGGDVNAETTYEDVTVYCRVSNAGLEGALERLLDAVAAPLLPSDAVRHEVCLPRLFADRMQLRRLSAARLAPLPVSVRQEVYHCLSR